MPPVAARRRPATAPGSLGLRLGIGLAALLAASACASPPDGPEGPAPGPAATPAGAPADASPYWVDPRSDAARQVAAWEARGRNADAQVLRRISERPTALWVPGGDPGPEVRRARASAGAAGRIPVFVAHNIPHRDCGPHPAGGARDARAYRAWIGALADGIGTAPALVVLEPGAVPHLLDGCTAADLRDERYALLSEAVARLKRNPGTKVYLDAGYPGWIKDPDSLAEPLLRAGLVQADGFSLNVSGFQSGPAVRSYGARISGPAKGSHFVVDTGRNGDGPLPGDGNRAGCNPPGRSLGAAPTARTGDPLVDAYLWIRPPGASDGPCRGGPAAGEWWPDYALGLARRARD